MLKTHYSVQPYPKYRRSRTTVQTGYIISFIVLWLRNDGSPCTVQPWCGFGNWKGSRTSTHSRHWLNFTLHWTTWSQPCENDSYSTYVVAYRSNLCAEKARLSGQLPRRTKLLKYTKKSSNSYKIIHQHGVKLALKITPSAVHRWCDIGNDNTTASKQHDYDNDDSGNVLTIKLNWYQRQ